ncbi:hypothetical protein PFLA_a1906 [Pseudoalteromonas flavipulchra NCIMB 2033 = ATCC BAA-314]|nr:hypothetical protein [Pseudoalteromonas flavipulchra NCIMB 2033 = ATCC BAA-314]
MQVSNCVFCHLLPVVFYNSMLIKVKVSAYPNVDLGLL